MHFLKNLLRFLVYFIILALLAGWLYIRYISYRGVPDYDGEVSLNGLKGKVTVYRDSLGIPHIYADNEEDLYRVTGYLEAQDRLWQMDLLRRVTQGRISEIFGKDFVQTDLLLRSLRIPEKSQMLLDSLDEPMMNSLEAFADGVNQYITTHHHSLPPEFTILGYKPDLWKPEHSLNIIGYIAWNLDAGHWGTEILLYKAFRKMGDQASFLLPGKGTKLCYVYPDFEINPDLLAPDNNLLSANDKLAGLGAEVFSGSNNWAVSPAKSVYDKALLANDMHLGLNMPGIWYQIHQQVKGKLHVTGVLFPGEPVVVAGHNDDIAWGITYLYADDLDLYHETLNTGKPERYKYDGQWLPLKRSPQTIRIKGGEEVHDTLLFTHRGPLVSRFGEVSEALSMRWGGNDYSNEYQGLYKINRAGNWQAFTEGLREFKSVNQNFDYADRHGNIGLYAAGGIPIRKGPAYLVLPGDTSLYDWHGKVPFDLLPHTYNPASHQVSSANNRTVRDNYPYYIGTYFAQFYRIARIRQMLNEKEKLDVRDFMKIQTDQHSFLASETLPPLLKILNKNINLLSEKEKKALTVLQQWDGDMGPQQNAPLIFEIFIKNFITETISDELGPAMTAEILKIRNFTTTVLENVRADTSSPWLDDISTPAKEDLTAIVLRSFHKMMTQVDQRYGSSPEFWTWGRIHNITLKHPLSKVKILDKVFHLNKGPYMVGGSFHTVCPYSYPLTGDPDGINHGASQRHIYVTGDWDKSFSVIPTGESGVPASDYYGNQTPLYTSGKYHRDYFSKELVVRHARHTATFVPVQ
jgi:penicillin amidase